MTEKIPLSEGRKAIHKCNRSWRYEKRAHSRLIPRVCNAMVARYRHGRGHIHSLSSPTRWAKSERPVILFGREIDIVRAGRKTRHTATQRRRAGVGKFKQSISSVRDSNVWLEVLPRSSRTVITRLLAHWNCTVCCRRSSKFEWTTKATRPKLFPSTERNIQSLRTQACGSTLNVPYNTPLFYLQFWHFTTVGIGILGSIYKRLTMFFGPGILWYPYTFEWALYKCDYCMYMLMQARRTPGARH